MPTLLQIDSSPLGESSVSRRLTREFAENWKVAHPGWKGDHAGRDSNRDLRRSERHG